MHLPYSALVSVNLTSRRRFLPDRLKEARHATGLSQERLALRIGIRARNIVRWENGQHRPNADHIAAIADATGKKIEFFFGDEEDEESDELMLDALLTARVRQIVRAELARANREEVST